MIQIYADTDVDSGIGLEVNINNNQFNTLKKAVHMSIAADAYKPMIHCNVGVNSWLDVPSTIPAATSYDPSAQLYLN